MIKNNKLKRVSGRFIWSEISHRSRFGGSKIIPQDQNTKSPSLWLTSMRKENEYGREVFLVNDSLSVIDFVEVIEGGFVTQDERLVSLQSQKSIQYSSVAVGEAVKVAEYDDVYDLDYVLILSLRLKTQSDCFEIQTSPQKGGPKEAPLMWRDGSLGKHCKIFDC